MSFSVYMTGLTMGLSLIVAIGAQNAFVLRQGLRNAWVFPVCLACSLSDALLIVLGTVSFGRISALMPMLAPAMRFGGAAFLIWYGVKSICSAIRSSDVLTINGSPVESLSQTLSVCLVLTWLNPHVYLDTVVLLGSISTQFPGFQLSFVIGAISASFLFFFSLGFGARWLRPIFAAPGTWRVLESLIALTMWAIAFKLLRGGC
jgi:L-lysine exporter family protein LysE/ArgO